MRRSAAQADAVRAAVIEAGATPGEPVAILARNGPGVVAASYGVMASARRRIRRRSQSRPRRRRLRDSRSWACAGAVAERDEAHRVAPLGLDVMVLEDIVARPAARRSRRRRSIRAPGARRS
jgi:hypothetical protein